jgi:Holliday junction resolvase RusA-like endonuclease
MKIIINQIGKIPSKKNNMKVFRNRMVKPKSLKEFEGALKLIAINQMTMIGGRTIDGDVSFDLDVTFGDKRKRDIQNCFGSICDALNDVCYHDDSQIVELSARKRYKKNTWKYTITIQSI